MAGFLLPVALVLAFAEAVVVPLLVAVAVTLAVAVAVPVAVALALELALELALPLAGLSLGLPLVLPPDGLVTGVAGAGVALGVTDLDGLAAADDEEVDRQVVSFPLLWSAEVRPRLAPPPDEPAWVPDPSALAPPLALEEENPTAVPSWTKASRSGGTAKETPMANTAQATARAGRSSPYRQSRGCLPRAATARATAARAAGAACRLLPAAHGVPAAYPLGQETQARGSPRMLARVGRAGLDPRADPLKPVRPWLHLVRGSVQRTTQVLGEVVSLRRHAVVAGSGHYSCSRAARRAVMPRAVWLFTAPRLIPIAVAISASDRSA